MRNLSYQDANRQLQSGKEGDGGEVKRIRQIRFPKISVLITVILTLFSCDESKDPLSCTDDSNCWTEFYTSLNTKSNALFFIDQNIGWAVGNEGQIIKTVNGGKTWEKQISGITWKLRWVFFLDKQNGWVSGNEKKLLRTTDGGHSWSIQDIESDSATVLGSIHFNYEGIGWFISNFGEIYCSLDSGNSWIRKHELMDWGYTYLFFPTKDVGFAMRTFGNQLRRTFDGGNSWETYPIPAQWAGDVFFIDKTNGWVTENWAPSSSYHDSSSLYHTTDGGITWELQVTLPRFPWDHLVFTDSQTGWMSNTVNIYHTINGGESWHKQFDSDGRGFIKDIFFINETTGWALLSDGYIVQYSND